MTKRLWYVTYSYWSASEHRMLLCAGWIWAPSKEAAINHYQVKHNSYDGSWGALAISKAEFTEREKKNLRLLQGGKAS